MILVETRDGALRPAMPPGRDLAQWHQVLAAELAQHLSPAHAALLARPERAHDGWAWVADGREMKRFADLSADDRSLLMAAAGAILSDIRRLAERGGAPAVRTAWPALREVPDPAYVFAVDGRPVLAAWGHAGSGLLARHDDGRAWNKPPRTPWPIYASLLAALALFALLAGLLAPVIARAFGPVPIQCTIAPDQLQLFRDQQREAERGDQLQTLLATLTDETGRRQLQCPIPVAPSPVAPPAPPASAAPPAPRAALPEQRWNEHDLSLLDGCWKLVTDMQLNHPGAPSQGIRSWQQCFSRDGHGTQTVVVSDTARCEGPLRAEFAGDRLNVTEPEACRGPGLSVARSVRACIRTNDQEAVCTGHDIEGTAQNETYTGTFRR